ncbi:MAG: DUF501 domain-containing protein [Acidimicrobiia bacterium]|nr:DUF501 domain-containing protein [Acidimicrobiia bacterium]MDH4308759.1 DUF501 domain-containing protein [Acidimicrobiia bacterium]
MSRQIIEAQIGRPIRAESEPVASCPLGLPVVVAVPPVLDDGTPFPTRFWLTCPLAVIRVGRIESVGGVRRMEAWLDAEPERRQRMDEAHIRYARQRDEVTPAPQGRRPAGGVAGSRAGVKCLHAHYADHAAGNDNLVGAAVAPFVEPLDCTLPCVEGDARNPRWVEPR